METIVNGKTLQPDDEDAETHHYSYILRIWRSTDGILKGYVLDPISNKTYPLGNIPVHWDGETELLVSMPVCENPLIEPFGCRLGVWEPSK